MEYRIVVVGSGGVGLTLFFLLHFEKQLLNQVPLRQERFDSAIHSRQLS